MDRSLEENDIPDETEEFIDLNIDEHAYIPAVHLYYNDDLTVAWLKTYSIQIKCMKSFLIISFD